MSGALFIVEGIDGSGKSTQIELLTARLNACGVDTMRIKFPNYASDSSALVRMYLSGKFGTDPAAVNAYAASSFYAVDRYASYMSQWGEAYRSGKVILSDRYVSSNIIHQSSKLDTVEEQTAFWDWLYDFEYCKLGIPKPDGVYFLDVSADIALGQVERRYGGDESKKDIHEKDVSYIRKCYNTGVLACGKGYMQRVNCVKDGRMLEPERICDNIFSYVSSALGL